MILKNDDRLSERVSKLLMKSPLNIHAQKNQSCPVLCQMFGALSGEECLTNDAKASIDQRPFNSNA